MIFLNLLLFLKERLNIEGQTIGYVQYDKVNDKSHLIKHNKHINKE